MYFEFEKLDVYQVALDFVVVADEICEALPPGRAYLKDQLRRSANSIPANIAEGVGESASHVLVCHRLHLVGDELVARGRELLLRLVAMLTSMVKSVGARPANRA